MSVAHARRTDPGSSKVAANVATYSMPIVKRSVLDLLSNNEALTGNTINEVYRSEGYPKCAWDSPRKRAGELVRDGYLTNVASGAHEALYVITDKGREAIA